MATTCWSLNFSAASKGAAADDALAVHFEGDRVGLDTVVVDGGRSVRKTKDCHSFALASPVLHGGRASATFRLDHAPRGSADVVGILPADLELNSRVLETEGRCVLKIGGEWGGFARVLCDGDTSAPIGLPMETLTEALARRPQFEISQVQSSGVLKWSPQVEMIRRNWKEGDLVHVDVEFESDTTAAVTIRFQGEFSEKRLLRNVPPCGLRFGVGIYGSQHGMSVVECAVAHSVA